MKNKKYFKIKFAFTLAEVIIVVGIIGIVAQMMIPTLMNDINKQNMAVSLKKAYAEINSAYQEIKAENGGNFAFVCDTTDNNICFADSFYKKIKTIKICDENKSIEQGCWTANAGTGVIGTHVAIVTSSGMFLVFNHEYSNCGNFKISGTNGLFCGFILVDVNGNKKPGKFGQDIFGMYVYNDVIKPWGAQDLPVLWSTYNVSLCSDSSPYGCTSEYLYK